MQYMLTLIKKNNKSSNGKTLYNSVVNGWILPLRTAFKERENESDGVGMTN